MVERDEMRGNDAGEVKGAGLFPAEGLAGGESERQREV